MQVQSTAITRSSENLFHADMSGIQSCKALTKQLIHRTRSARGRKRRLPPRPCWTCAAGPSYRQKRPPRSPVLLRPRPELFEQLRLHRHWGFPKPQPPAASDSAVQISDIDILRAQKMRRTSPCLEEVRYVSVKHGVHSQPTLKQACSLPKHKSNLSLNPTTLDITYYEDVIPGWAGRPGLGGQGAPPAQAQGPTARWSHNPSQAAPVTRRPVRLRGTKKDYLIKSFQSHEHPILTDAVHYIWTFILQSKLSNGLAALPNLSARLHATEYYSSTFPHRE